MTEAFGGVALDRLLIEGDSINKDIRDALTDEPIVERTLDGAPTLTLNLEDPYKTILRGGLASKRISCQLDDYSFELAQVSKTGSSISLVFEDHTVAVLRRHRDYLKIDKDTLSRSNFLKQLVAEEPWIKFVTAPTPDDIVHKEMSRGTPRSQRQLDPELRESTWEASGRLAAEVNWRRFVPKTGLFYFWPDDQLIQQASIGTVSEADDWVDTIDFDYDTGKPVGTCTIKVMAERWTAPAGSVITVTGCGPADGKFLVEKITRPLTSVWATITGTRPKPALAEPTASGQTSGIVDAGGGIDVGTIGTPHVGTLSAAGFQWPLQKAYRITGRFGDARPKPTPHIHKGLDMACPDGTPVLAAALGTVTYSGFMPGYGNIVEINHGHGITAGKSIKTRYAHLAKISVARGIVVQYGTVIGESGGGTGTPSDGDATGPHLHFEVLVDGKQVDPLGEYPKPGIRYLP